MAKNKTTQDTEKKASNFELNVLKLGIHTFQLEKGDVFETNGKYFGYVPVGEENKNKLPWKRWNRTRLISCVKYKKDVLRADNIELVVNQGDVKKWVVKYAYKAPEVEKRTLWMLYVSLEDKQNFEFEAQELEIERETNEFYFLKRSNPVTYHTKIEKKGLLKPEIYYSKNYIYCELDDYDKAELLLMKATEERYIEQVETAKENLKLAEQRLSNMKNFKEKQGY